MRLEMVNGMQNEFLVGIKKLPFYVSFRVSSSRERAVPGIDVRTLKMPNHIQLTSIVDIMSSFHKSKSNHQTSQEPQKTLNLYQIRLQHAFNSWILISSTRTTQAQRLEAAQSSSNSYS